MTKNWDIHSLFLHIYLFSASQSLKLVVSFENILGAPGQGKEYKENLPDTRSTHTFCQAKLKLQGNQMKFVWFFLIDVNKISDYTMSSIG